MRPWLLLAAVLVASAPLLAACGSDDSSGGISVRGTIVFSSPNGTAAAIYVLGDGKPRLVARDGSVAAAQPAWSPDGKLIAYVNRRGQIVVVGRDGTGAIALTPTVDPNDPGGKLVWNPAWMPDGRLAFAVTQQTPNALALEAVRPEGTGLRQLSNRNTDAAAFSGVYSWSPDGTRLIFVCSFGDLTRQRLCLFDTASGRVRRLAVPPHRVSQLDWSQDGTRVLASEASDSSSHADQRLRLAYVLDPRGRLVRSIRQRRAVSDAAWSPDGKLIVYSSESARTGRFSLWVANADGTVARRLTALTGVEPDWTSH